MSMSLYASREDYEAAKADRELLERAAAAAGIEILRCRLDDPMWNDMLLSDAMFSNGRRGWNPLTDDGDALRLAVRLGMVLDVRYTDPAAMKHNEVRFWPPNGGAAPWKHMAFDDIETDPNAATRRAIVRAAAAMKE